MRKNIFTLLSREYRIFSFVIIVVLLYSVLCCVRVYAQEPDALKIVLYDHEPDTGIPKEDNIFLEGHEYGILVVYERLNAEGEIERGVATNVRVTVPWSSYVTSETTPEISLVAPAFSDYREFTITASRIGYQTAEKVIVVIKGELVVSTDRGTIDEGGSFQVVVYDKNDQPVKDCIVYIQNGQQQGDSEQTNDNGIVYLSAPLIESDDEIVTVFAYKDGYLESSTTIRVENAATVTIAADLMTILPIAIAVVVVIVSMIVVRMRGSPFEEPETPSQTMEIPKFELEEKPVKTPFFSRKKPSYTAVVESAPPPEESTLAKNEPKIEEIRIPAGGKRKETMYLTPEQEKIEPLRRPSKPEDQWFEGTDDVRYKIDKVTGRVDEKQKDRWFEGTDDIRKKIDDAISKKNKKKNQ